jgi:hypothetical protein
MTFGLPAFFGRKARSITPPGVDVTTITDISGSMANYAAFITSAGLYEALETALQAEAIGTLTATPNKYSFCIGGDTTDNTLAKITRNVSVSGSSQLWALGSDVLAQTVTYPTYNISPTNPGNEDMALSTNLVSNNNRTYNTLNERIIVAGSDEQSGQATNFDATPLFSQRYVGIHSAALTINETTGLTPIPSGTLVGFVYTTSSEGVAIYIDGSTINYRDQMPTSVFSASPGTTDQTQACLDQCKTTNGALYNITFFTSTARYALLGESLGSVLGKYLYSVS